MERNPSKKHGDTQNKDRDDQECIKRTPNKVPAVPTDAPRQTKKNGTMETEEHRHYGKLAEHRSLRSE